MKTSQAELLSIALNSLMEEKGIVGLKLARNKRMIDDELKEYYEFKQELFKKYGEEKDGNLVIAKGSKNYSLFMKEIEPLENQDVNFNFRIITENELIESGLSAKQISLIWDMVEEKQDG